MTESANRELLRPGPTDTPSRVSHRSFGILSRPRLPPTLEDWGGVGDVGFLFLVYCLSAIVYIPYLGFYSDDWSFLSQFDLRGDHSIFSVINQMIERSTAARPIQTVWLAIMYTVFGLAPLGYHICNSVILLANALLFYLCLRELQQPRLITVAVPALYLTIPTYSTIHFWTATSQVTISMAFYFISLYCDLRTLRASRAQGWILKTASIGAVIGSALAYEITIPLFLFINPLLLWHAAKENPPQSSKPSRTRVVFWIVLARNILLVALLFAFKKSVRPDMMSSDGIEVSVGYIYYLLHRLITRTRNEASNGFNLWQFIDIDLFERGLKLPLLALKGKKYVHWPELAATGGLAAIGFAYLRFVSPPLARSHYKRLVRPRGWLELSAVGLASALAGYAVFFVLGNVHFTIAGIGNRGSMAATAGIAVFLVGVIGHFTCDLPTERLRRATFALLTGLFMASGCLVNYAIASHWISAYQRETEILTAIGARFPALPKGGTFILDGTCPYIGPGIVFESSWDLAGALGLLYRDPDLRADVVTPRLEILQNGLRATLYGDASDYPYGPNLIIYNIGFDIRRRLTDRQAAESYFAEVGRDPNRCVWGETSVGVPIF